MLHYFVNGSSDQWTVASSRLHAKEGEFTRGDVGSGQCNNGSRSHATSSERRKKGGQSNIKCNVVLLCWCWWCTVASGAAVETEVIPEVIPGTVELAGFRGS